MKDKRTILIVGRKKMVLDEVRKKLPLENIDLLMAISLDEVKTEFKDATIDLVIMGAGIDPEQRLEIVRYIFQSSTST